MRVVRGPSETLFLSAPYAWNDFDVSRLRGLGGLEEILSESGTARLEVASARLADGTLLQVGKSSENREALLARYRTVLAIISLVIVAVGLAGGAIVTRSTLQPIRQLITAVRGIVGPDALTPASRCGGARCHRRAQCAVQRDARSHHDADSGDGARPRQRGPRPENADDEAARCR